MHPPQPARAALAARAGRGLPRLGARRDRRAERAGCAGSAGALAREPRAWCSVSGWGRAGQRRRGRTGCSRRQQGRRAHLKPLPLPLTSALSAHAPQASGPQAWAAAAPGATPDASTQVSRGLAPGCGMCLCLSSALTRSSSCRGPPLRRRAAPASRRPCQACGPYAPLSSAAGRTPRCSAVNAADADAGAEGGKGVQEGARGRTSGYGAAFKQRQAEAPGSCGCPGGSSSSRCQAHRSP
jgi:hypothetical protein